MLILFSGLIYMIDTLSLGMFKKIKWLQKIYYPIYVFYGYITLSTIYRSIYYALISRFSKKLILSILLPYIFIFALLPFHKFDQHQFYPDHPTTAEIQAAHYDDQRGEDHFIQNASIPSMFTNQPYLPLFIRYDASENQAILHLCTDYVPSKSSGLISGIRIGRDGFGFNTPDVQEADPEKLLQCLSRVYSIYINDSLYQATDFHYYTHVKNEELGIQTVIPTTTLPKGKNVITVKHFKLKKNEEKLEEKEYAVIPFWLE